MKLDLKENFEFSENWQRIITIDAHTAGEPLRMVIEGFPEIKGKTILEKRRFARQHYDHLRKALMWEPRGHVDMYGAIPVEPQNPEADFGVLFIHNEGFSTMCGHGIIALTKIVLQTGMVPVHEPETVVKIETPAGLVTAFARINRGQVQSVYFNNVPSFVLLSDHVVEVEGLGQVPFDVAFGGAFYAFVDADQLGIDMSERNVGQLIEKGMAVKKAVMENFEIKHPFDEDLSFLYGTIFYGKSHSPRADSRNVCIFADGEVDRSPTGTGVSARMALHYFKKQLSLQQSMIIESVIGTTFKGRPMQEVRFGPHSAVIPEVEGNAYLTGRNEWWIDPDDPLQFGFLLR